MMVAKDRPRLLGEGRSFRQHRGVSVQTVLFLRLRSFHKRRTRKAPWLQGSCLSRRAQVKPPA
jgi:hypothetical protein